MKRVLIISYYFPPSGGPGVQRILKTVRYLRDFGWEPVVLTVKGGAYPVHDASLTHDVPAGLTIHRTPTWDPFQWYARLTGQSTTKAVKTGSLGRETGWAERLAWWVRANIFLPDARVGWLPFAVIAGQKILRRQPFDAVLTSGPPHSVHLTGYLLRRLNGTKWLADFRDPWTDITYYHEMPQTTLALRLDASLERLVLRSADRVTTVSPTWRDLLAAKTGNPEKVAVVQNGFDETDIPPSTAIPHDVFWLTHIGSLYATRNPEALWVAVAQLQAEGVVPRLRVRLVGKVDPVVRETVQRYGLEGIVEVESYVPHAEAVRCAAASGMLLLVIESFQHDAGMITGKLYEYLAAGRPVLGIGPSKGDAARLLGVTSAGEVFDHTDVDSIARFIRRHYDSWASGHPLAGAVPGTIARYSRRVQTGAFAAVLDSLTEQA